MTGDNLRVHPLRKVLVRKPGRPVLLRMLSSYCDFPSILLLELHLEIIDGLKPSPIVGIRSINVFPGDRILAVAITNLPAYGCSQQQ